MDITIRKGLDVRISGAPLQVVGVEKPVRSVAILGSDYPGLRPDFRVSLGERVRQGQPLFSDRQHPQMLFAAPSSGVVSKLELGSRRMLSILVIDAEPEDERHGQDALTVPDMGQNAEDIRSTLLERGFWPAFISRPFGRIPDPDAKAAAILVRAMDSHPLAPDASVVLEPQKQNFSRGVELVSRLTDGPVFVCQAPGHELLSAASQRIKTARFSGPHPCGTGGVHLHHLFPASVQNPVWTIDYQDVVAIGDLYKTGRFMSKRVISLAGPGVKNPKLLRAPMGSSTGDIVDGELIDERLRIISGPVLSGREAAYLGRYHAQISVLKAERKQSVRSPLSRLISWQSAKDRRPIVAMQMLDQVLPLDVLPVPLMRALSVGDAETAKKLGCLALVEEDVALLSYLCVSGADYGAMLRRVLNELAEAA